MELTKAERLILMNQYSILELLSRAFPEHCSEGNTINHDPEFYKRASEVMRDGYQLLINTVSHVQDSHLTYEHQKEILDIMTMHEVIQASFNRLEDKDGLTPEDVEFDGFDGNADESGFAYAFCKFHENHKPFESINPLKNSHMPTMGIYRRMLVKYNELWKANPGTDFSAAEIKEILAERIHPDKR